MLSGELLIKWSIRSTVNNKPKHIKLQTANSEEKFSKLKLLTTMNNELCVMSSGIITSLFISYQPPKCVFNSKLFPSLSLVESNFLTEIKCKDGNKENQSFTILQMV